MNKIKYLAAASLALAAASCTPAHATQLEEACAEMAPVYVDINRAYNQGIKEGVLAQALAEASPPLTESGVSLALALVRIRYLALKDVEVSDLDFAGVAFHVCVDANSPEV